MINKRYLRFKDIPDNEKSNIHNSGSIIGQEIGVSVYSLNDKNEIILPIKVNDDVLEFDKNIDGLVDDLSWFISRFKRNEITAYIVSGDEVGVGSDGEPLLQNIKIINKLKNKVMDDNNTPFVSEVDVTKNISYTLDDKFLNKLHDSKKNIDEAQKAYEDFISFNTKILDENEKKELDLNNFYLQSSTDKPGLLILNESNLNEFKNLQDNLSKSNKKHFDTIAEVEDFLKNNSYIYNLIKGKDYIETGYILTKITSWIPTQRELPKEGKKVLVISDLDISTVEICRYNNGRFKMVAKTPGQDSFAVNGLRREDLTDITTHWKYINIEDYF